MNFPVGARFFCNAEKRHRKQNRDSTLISDTIDRRIKHKIYVTKSDARKLLDWADSFSKMAFDYEKRNSKSKRYSKIRSIVERFDSKIRKSKTKKLSRRSTYMEEDGFNYSLQAQDELDAKHRNLYERYKEGDQEAYKQAVELEEQYELRTDVQSRQKVYGNDRRIHPRRTEDENDVHGASKLYKPNGDLRKIYRERGRNQEDGFNYSLQSQEDYINHLDQAVKLAENIIKVGASRDYCVIVYLRVNLNLASRM